MTDELDNWYNDWNVEPMPSRQKEKLQALIDRECNKARIEELERQEFQDVMMLYAEYETREVVTNRITELSNKENK